MNQRSSEHLVTSADEVADNIRRFADELAGSRELQARLGQVHAWYAIWEAGHQWMFGPSKFVGYRANSADLYLTFDPGRGADGRETEKRLEKWFQPVDQNSTTGLELARALKAFLARWGRAPRKDVRINVLNSFLDEMPETPIDERRDASLLARISIDPNICGGRPCIRGTRMRVSDLIDMLVHGATSAEILADYPYLAERDIAAALAYAARATSHRVIRAA